MANSMLDDFINEKRAESKFLSLKNGESAVIKKVLKMYPLKKESFGAVKNVLRLEVMVDYGDDNVVQKDFDNATGRFAEHLGEMGVDVGSSFTITRNGEKEKTRYTLTNVVNVNKTVSPGQTAIGGAAPAAGVAKPPVTPNPTK